MGKGQDIADRLLGLAVGVLRLVEQLPRDGTGRHITEQLARSATGAGANYEEARAAESRDDFVHKVLISAKETRETAFWLALLARSNQSSPEAVRLLSEANELAAILAASARTARGHSS